MNEDIKGLLVFAALLLLLIFGIVLTFAFRDVEMAKLGMCQTMGAGYSDPIWTRCEK